MTLLSAILDQTRKQPACTGLIKTPEGRVYEVWSDQTMRPANADYCCIPFTELEFNRQGACVSSVDTHKQV